ncbi:STAS domain-containing protein [Pseudonocardia sp. NPDC049635]|uniref:STAS domain-containing protein n=1 Tax=Pseudonocardia sp. NPDC049635 TaxID=3155506 RepID=UPI0034056E78
MGPHEGALAVSTPRDDVYLITVRGVLDRVLSTRLLRMVDTRVRVVRDAGGCLTRHLLIDMSPVVAVGRGALELLEHARHSTGVHGVTLHLTAPDPEMWRPSARAREIITSIGTFPSVALALRAL